MPKSSSSDALKAPILLPPTTVIPLSNAFMISLWATAGVWWKAPSMIPIMSGFSDIAFRMSPLLTGGL